MDAAWVGSGSSSTWRGPEGARKAGNLLTGTAGEASDDRQGVPGRAAAGLGKSVHWLDARRVRMYPRIVAAIFLVVSVIWVARSHDSVDLMGKPLGCDFITYWAASRMALAGQASQAYSLASMFHVEHLAVPASDSMFAWYYPPAFYLVALPLGLMPYLVAYGVFSAVTLALYVYVMRRTSQGREWMWCLAGFSGVWLNLLQGQNGFLTGALAGGAVLALRRRPVLAGVLVGLLAIKPHLALLFPVALVAIRAWRTLAAAAVTAIAFTGAGVAVLGVATLRACIGSLAEARRFVEQGSLPWAKMPTVFAALRLAGASVWLAYAAHAVVAAGAAAVTWRVWRRCGDWQVRGAVLLSATFLVSPYVFDYDLAWLAFPIAWLAAVGMRDGWLRGEREWLVAAWLLPVAMAPLASATHVQIGPVVTAGLVWLGARRAGVVPAGVTACVEESAVVSALARI